MTLTIVKTNFKAKLQSQNVTDGFQLAIKILSEIVVMATDGYHDPVPIPVGERHLNQFIDNGLRFE
jgi:hypothetical protein